jgi:glycosyltransferase involved in cell wall biosynthesis
MPTVSVIMPAHNARPYLADAAHSVLRQTFRDLELIIVDDGSTDGTGGVAERIKRGEPRRVVVIAQANRGPGAARNAGLDAARGKFIALLDSDDIWEPPFLERQLAILGARPDVDLVTGNGWSLGGPRHGTLVHPHPDPRPPITLATIIADEEAVFVMTVFRRRVFESIGGFNESPGMSEDFDYWLRAALAGFRFARNDEPLAWYRRRDGSFSSDEVRVLQRALRVCEKTRPLLAATPEGRLLEEKIAYYEAEIDFARTRQALRSGDVAAIAAAVGTLHTRRPSFRTAIAAFLARHAAPLLSTLYQLRLRSRHAQT